MTANKPSIDKRKRLPVIWFIPVLALAIGIWMVIDTKLSQGPQITIQFDTADGIAAGKTKVRYLSVEVGLVESVTLSHDQQTVLVSVQLIPEAVDLVREDTEFWVVRARVGMGNVSGLGTLLGGAYIKLSPGASEVAKSKFVGLETPPLTPLGAPGLKLNLFANEAGSVGTGDAVLYNGYKVGRVEGMSFDGEQNLIRYDLFIDSPYDKLVTSSVRFWNVSGIEMTASASGIELQTGSLDTLLLGGVAFGVPEGLEPGVPVENGSDFKLYNDYAAMQEQPYIHSVDYVMEFQQSLRGLLPGAPVEYRGIPLGYVKRVLVKEMMAAGHERNAPIPVLVTIEPGRVGMPDTEESVAILDSRVRSGVPAGLRGTLETGNILTGSLYISIDYKQGAEPEEIGEFLGYSTLPTMPSGLKLIEERLNTLLSTLNELPYEATLETIDATMLAMKDTLKSIDDIVQDTNAQQVPAEVSKTLVELRTVLSGFREDSPLYQGAEASISKLQDVLYQIDQLSRTVKNQPNSLLFNPKLPEDPVPGTPSK